MPQEEKPFNLLRWFSILSLLSISAITVFFAVLLSRLLSEKMIQRDAVLTMEFVQTLLEGQETAAYFGSAGADPSREILENFFEKMASMPEVVRTNVYAKDGTIIWSNDRRFIGHRFDPNPELEEALSGRLAVHSGESGRPMKPEHVFDEDVPYFAEFYIPIRDGGKESVAGVVEVYKNPVSLFHEIEQGRRRVWLSALLGGLFLYATLFWIVRRAAAVIRRQRERQTATANELTRLQGQLVQAEKLSAIGELVSGVAHELNNPLTSIIGFSELLLTAPEPGSIQKRLKIIQSEALRCSKIIENLLAFARREAFSPRETDLHALLKRTLEIKARPFLLNDIEVKIDFEDSFPAVSADESQIQQVFMNILNNAQQAMMEKTDRRTLVIEGRRKEGFIQIVFKDSGPGIPEALLPKIFDPFFTTKPVGVGTGLGLSVSYGIIKAHGGRLFAESRRGVGAQIYIELPIKPIGVPVREGAEEAAESPSRGDRAVLSGKRILVVDDEAHIVEMIRNALLQRGADVTTAPDGPEALAWIERRPFDLILTDIKMPRMDGVDLFTSIIHLSSDFSGKVIFLTGDTLNPRTREFLDRGGHPFLAKPFEIEQLLNTVLKKLDPAPNAEPRKDR